MEPPISPLLYAVLLFFGMLILLEIGRRLGVRRRPKESEGERGSLGTIEGAVFALFGLMVAFTFSGAASRFNEKRMLIAEEANTIETAYLRLHLVPQEAQPALQELFRRICGLSIGDLSQAAKYGGGQDGDGQIQEAPGRDLDRSSGRYTAPEFSSRRGQATASRAKQHDRHHYYPLDGAANPPPENHLCAFVRPGSHLLPAGWLSDVKWPTPELAAHPRFHGHNGHHRLRHARR